MIFFLPDFGHLEGGLEHFQSLQNYFSWLKVPLITKTPPLRSPKRIFHLKCTFSQRTPQKSFWRRLEAFTSVLIRVKQCLGESVWVKKRLGFKASDAFPDAFYPSTLYFYFLKRNFVTCGPGTEGSFNFFF